jgi:Flp pilus assembly protein TadG
MMGIRRLIARRTGQAMVEFAILIPFFFLLLVGTLDFGRAGFYYVVTSSLARTGARQAAAYDTGQGLTDAQITGIVAQQAQALTVSTLTQPANCGTTTPPSPLTSCYQPPTGQGYIFIDRSGFTSFPKYVTVSVVYHFEATTPMVRAVISTIYLVGTATMETEY